jgi:hypothetical protein
MFIIPEVTAIAIILNDNDFGSTFKPLLESIKNALEHNPNLTRENVTRIINSGIEFHYHAFQLGNNCNKQGYGTVKETIEYLTTEMRILYNEEAVRDVFNEYRNGGAWFLDTTSGQVTTY